MIMEDLNPTSIDTDHEASPPEESDLESVLGSGFEEEQPEDNFDERI